MKKKTLIKRLENEVDNEYFRLLQISSILNLFKEEISNDLVIIQIDTLLETIKQEGEKLLED